MRRVLIVAASLLIAVPVAAAAGETRSRKPCGRTDSQTLKSNALVRVYRVGREVFACYRKSGRARFLESSGSDFPSDVESLSIIRLAGRFVAFDEGVGCDRYYGDCQASVVVFDVRTGRVRHRQTVRDSQLSGEPPSQLPGVSDLQLRANGSAALIIGPNEVRELEVWKLDAEGRTRLDQGADVERGSLAISARWVYWRRGGNAFSSPLR